MKDTINIKVHLIWPSIIFVFHSVSFLSCHCLSFGKLSSFLVYYEGLLTSATPDQLSRWRSFSGQTNTETNEVIRSVFRTFPQFAASTAGRRMWCDTNANTKEASTNLQPHKVGLYATELFNNTFDLPFGRHLCFNNYAQIANRITNDNDKKGTAGENGAMLFHVGLISICSVYKDFKPNACE